jgi:hypothetical protein
LLVVLSIPAASRLDEIERAGREDKNGSETTGALSAVPAAGNADRT